MELKDRLMERGYRGRSVEEAINKVRELNREDILQKVTREDKNKNRVRAVFLYDRRLPNISAIMIKNWKTMLTDDSRLKKVFQEPPMVCFRRGKNLREKIVQAKLPPDRFGRPTEQGFKRCGRPKCRLCPYTNIQLGEIQKYVTISNTGEILPIKGNLSCRTKNILYLGTCSKGDRTCPDRPQYCGETGQSAEERFCGHRNTVTQACHENTTIPVGEHFRGAGHSLSDFVFTPVEKINSNNIFVRKVREKLLINQLNLIDSGLNKRL